MGTVVDRHQFHGTTHGPHQFADDGKANATPLTRCRSSSLPLDEGIEDAQSVFRCDTRPLVDTLEA